MTDEDLCEHRWWGNPTDIVCTRCKAHKPYPPSSWYWAWTYWMPKSERGKTAFGFVALLGVVTSVVALCCGVGWWSLTAPPWAQKLLAVPIIILGLLFGYGQLRRGR
ncbi:hypothetical protein [Longispora urticae]